MMTMQQLNFDLASQGQAFVNPKGLLGVDDCHRPELATKNLAFNTVQGRRKVRISSNFLPIFDFTPDTRITTNLLGHREGFEVVVANDGPLKIHTRGYGKQRNAPLECVAEFGSQSLIQQAFPSYTERYHVEFQRGVLRVRPLPNQVFAIHRRHKGHKDLSAYVALTGGVDALCMANLGWNIAASCDWRPIEARDKDSDWTEINALNTVAQKNIQPDFIFNEDLYALDPQYVASLFEGRPPLTTMHFSLQCDDSSASKSKQAKQQSINDMSTTIDMLIPALDQIKACKPATVVIEQVPGFLGRFDGKDAAYGLGHVMIAQLRRMGYFVTADVLNSLDYGARQQRKRAYIVASIWPGYQHPLPTGRRTDTLKELIINHLEDASDVTDTKLFNNGTSPSRREAKATKGRKGSNILTIDSLYSGTFLKSQGRVDDAQFIEHQGRIYRIGPSLMQKLMSIPDDFDAGWMRKEQQTEVLGQSLDYALHHAVMAQLKAHIKANL